MRVLAIDPGPVQSALVLLDGSNVLLHEKVPNTNALLRIMAKFEEAVVIEMIASYGMPVGAEVFETCVWIGRFEQAAGLGRVSRIFRRDVKLHWCGSVKAKDGNVRQAVIDFYGGKDKAIGKKKNPGPCHGVTKDVWQALALGLAWQQTKGAK